MHSSSVITISYLIHHIGLIRHSVNASYASSLRYSSHLPASVENLVVERRRNTIAGCLLKLMHLLNARKKKLPAIHTRRRSCRKDCAEESSSTYVGLGAATPVMSLSSSCTGAQVQKRLVSPYAIAVLAVVLPRYDVGTHHRPSARRWARTSFA
jgi:hypothetical protein